MTFNCASERASDALIVATSSSEILSLQARGRALPRLLDLGLVDVIGGDGHVGDDRDAIGCDLDDAFADGQERLVAVLAAR